jgi:hypothetical protein
MLCKLSPFSLGGVLKLNLLCVDMPPAPILPAARPRASVSIRQHTSTYARMSPGASGLTAARTLHRYTPQHTLYTPLHYTPLYTAHTIHTSAYVSIRQHTSAYVSIRQHTSEAARSIHRYTPLTQYTPLHLSPELLTSPHELRTSPHELRTSPHELPTSPHELPTSPHELPSLLTNYSSP